jgi:hypothetical protein
MSRRFPRVWPIRPSTAAHTSIDWGQTVHTGSRGETIVRTRIVTVAALLATVGVAALLGLAQTGATLAGYTWSN